MAVYEVLNRTLHEEATDAGLVRIELAAGPVDADDLTPAERAVLDRLVEAGHAYEHDTTKETD